VALLIVISLLSAWLPHAQYFQPITLRHHSPRAHGGVVLFTYQGIEGVEGPPVWLSESRYLAFLSSFGYSVQVWDPTVGKLIQNPLEPVPYAGLHTTSAWSWSPDGRYLAVTSEDTSSRNAAVQVWDVTTGRNTLTVRNHANGFLYTAWSFDDTRIAFSGDDGTVQIWNPLTGKKLSIFAGHPSTRHSLFWSADDALLLVSSPDGTFQLWNVFTGTNISTFHGAASLVALSPDGRWLVSRENQQVLQLQDYSDDRDMFHVWNTFTGRDQVTYQGPPGAVSFLEWSPESSRVLIANESVIQIRDVISGQTLLALPNPAMSSTGQPSFESGRSFTANDSEVQVWNSLTGHTLMTFPNPASNREWQISPNGQYFAFGSRNGVQIWNATTGREMSFIPDQIAHVQLLVWSPDSQHIAFARTDGTVEIWNAVTGSGVVTYQGLAHVVSLTWSPDGRLIAATSEDNTVRVLQAT
jgi:WD40 repeat protein